LLPHRPEHRYCAGIYRSRARRRRRSCPFVRTDYRFSRFTDKVRRKIFRDDCGHRPRTSDRRSGPLPILGLPAIRSHVDVLERVAVHVRIHRQRLEVQVNRAISANKRTGLWLLNRINVRVTLNAVPVLRYDRLRPYSCNN